MRTIFHTKCIFKLQLYKHPFHSSELKQPRFTCVNNWAVHSNQTKCACVPTVAYLSYFEGVSVWLCTGSLVPALQAQEHHFSPDELSRVITVPQRPVTQIKAALPRLASTQSCLCSPDPALMRNSTLLPRHIIPFPFCLAPFYFYSIPLWFDLNIMGSRMGCFFAKFIMQQKHSHLQFHTLRFSCFQLAVGADCKIENTLQNAHFAPAVLFQSMSKNKGWNWV